MDIGEKLVDAVDLVILDLKQLQFAKPIPGTPAFLKRSFEISLKSSYFLLNNQQKGIFMNINKNIG